MAARVGTVRRAALTLTLCLGMLTVLMLTIGHGTLDHVWRLGLPRCLLQFSAGVALWRLLALHSVTPSIGNRLFVQGCALLLLALLVPMVQLVAPPAFCLLIAACAVRSPIAERALGNRAVLLLGEISFSIYLLHVIILGIYATIAEHLGIGGGSWAAWLFFISAPITVVLLSALVWFVVERPAQALGHRLRRRAAASFSPNMESTT